MIERRFLAMTAGPQPLDEVRVLLLKRQTSWVTKDAVWQELVRRAHAEPEPWTTVAAAMMMPGLKHIGGKLGSRFPGNRNDLDSAILEGFLQALDITDARARKVYGQLYWAAFRRGHEVCNSERRRAMTRSELTDVADLRNAHREVDWIDAEPASAAAADCKETCRLCPVRLTCAITAFTTDESYGVWGGMDQVDREALRHADAQLAA